MPEIQDFQNKPPEGFKYSRANRTNLRAASQGAKSLIADLLDQYCAAQPRKLTTKNIQLYSDHFEIVLLDLLSAWEADPVLWIGYSRGKREFLKGGRYWNPLSDSPTITQRPFINAIDCLGDIGWVENWTASAGYEKYSSRFRATEEMVEFFRAYGLNWTSYKEDESAAYIVVKDKHKKIVPYPDEDKFSLQQALENVSRINQNLADSYLNLHISDEKFEQLRSQLARESNADGVTKDALPKEPVDFSNRCLKRIFANGSFSNGGRFYGGWWQQLPSALRKHIEIDGKVTVEMDYSTMTPRILYARVGMRPPEDSYLLDGWDKKLRPIIKKAFNQLLNSDKTSENRNQWHRFAPDTKHVNEGIFGLPIAAQQKAANQSFFDDTGREYKELLSDLIAKHESIVKFFFSSMWGEMQNLDSQIAEMVMLDLLDNSPRVIALPIHDSFIVRRSAEELLADKMRSAFEQIIGASADIDRDETIYDPPNDKEEYGLIAAGPDLHNETMKDMIDYASYHLREAQWIRTHGSNTFD